MFAVLQENPKKVGSKSFDRYELYKAARSIEKFFELGGTRADLKHDTAKGFITGSEAGAVTVKKPSKRSLPCEEATSRKRGPYNTADPIDVAAPVDGDVTPTVHTELAQLVCEAIEPRPQLYNPNADPNAGAGHARVRVQKMLRLP